MRLHIINDHSHANFIQEAAVDAGFSPDGIAILKSAPEARELLQKEIPDIAVVDPHLTPNECLEDGIELIWEIRELSRACIIICLTARGSTELGVRAIQQGADNYIDMSWSHINWTALTQNTLDLYRRLLLSQQQT